MHTRVNDGAIALVSHESRTRLKSVLGWIRLLRVGRLRRSARPKPARIRKIEPPPATASAPLTDSGLDRGLDDIRRTDPGFDPSRFVGYIGMMFRTTQNAWVTGDIESLHDRITPKIRGELRARRDALHRSGRASRIEDIEITATVTKVWQQNDHDYVTARIGGTLVDYTVDEVNARVVAGSKTAPRAVEEFWTFTRPAGLNFWMLCAVRT